MTELDNFSFDIAISKLKAGKKVARYGWTVYLEVIGTHIFVREDADSMGTEWQATSKDLLANDWYLKGE